jgi:hypothetical protein
MSPWTSLQQVVSGHTYGQSQEELQHYQLKSQEMDQVAAASVPLGTNHQPVHAIDQQKLLGQITRQQSKEMWALEHLSQAADSAMANALQEAQIMAAQAFNFHFFL